MNALAFPPQRSARPVPVAVGYPPASGASASMARDQLLVACRVLGLSPPEAARFVGASAEMMEAWIDGCVAVPRAVEMALIFAMMLHDWHGYSIEDLESPLSGFERAAG